MNQIEEELLLKQFQQQQMLLEALARTNQQLLVARDQALLAEQMEQLSMSVGEARPVDSSRPSNKREHSGGAMFMSDDYEEDEIVYRSCGDDPLSESSDAAEVASPVSGGACPSVKSAQAQALQNCTALERQVALLSQMLQRLQDGDIWDSSDRAGDAILELQALNAEMLEIR